MDTIISLGADELATENFGDAFVIYVGTHGDAGAHRADVILPSAAYTEKSATYVNMEGRVQRTTRAVGLKGEAREDWTIMRALSDRLGKPLPYNDLAELRAAMAEANPVFLGSGYAPATTGDSTQPPYGEPGEMNSSPFKNKIKEFHLSNPIARASKVMAECAALASGASPAQAAE